MSYLSATYQQSQPPRLGNIALVDNVLSTLQGNYDKNVSEQERTIEMYNAQLKSLRPEDNAYISAKLKQVEAQVNAYSIKNGNMARNYNHNSVMSTIKGVLDDPIIQDAMISSQNNKALQKQADDLFKKDPKLFSQGNMQDARDQGGFKAYMAGETNRLGAMTLTPYTDVQKDLNERVSKWAKDNGYNTTFNSENKGLFFQNTKGISLTKAQIINFLDVNVDPVIQNQMNINSRQSYGKLSDEDFKNTAINFAQKDIDEDNDILISQKVLLKTKSGEVADIIKQNISKLELRIKDNQGNITSGNFDRNLQYGFYKKNLFGGLAKTYEKDVITDVTYDDTPLKIAQFAFSQEKFKVEMDLAERKLQLDKYKADNKNSKGVDVSTGSALAAVPEPGADPVPIEEQLVTNTIETGARLRQQLASEDSEFRTATKADQDKYLQQVMAGDGVINPRSEKPMTLGLVNAVNAHRDNYVAYGKYINQTSKYIEDTTVEQYNDMLGNTSLNTSNLASTMPTTAQAIRDKRSFNSMTAEQKDMIRYERAVTQVQFDDNLSDTETKALQRYTKRLEVKNKDSRAFQANKVIVGDAEYIGDSVTNFFSKGLVGVAGKTFKNTGDMVQNVVRYGVDTAFGDTDAKYKFSKRVQEDLTDLGDIGKNIDTLRKSREDTSIFSMFTEDTNITEVDRGGDTKSGSDLSAKFREGFRREMVSVNNFAKKYMENVTDKMTYSFSTQDKAQVGTASLLYQTIQNQRDSDGDPLYEDNQPDLKDNNYNVEYFASQNGYKIRYLDEDGVQQITGIIDTQLMPRAVVNAYAADEGNWYTSPKNPNAVLPKLNYSRPDTIEEKNKLQQDFSLITGDAYTPMDLLNLMEEVGQTPTQRTEDYMTTVPTELKDSQELKQDLIKIFSTEVQINNKKYGDQGFIMYPVITLPNKEVKTYDSNASGLRKIVPEYDPITNFNLQLKMVKDTQEYHAAELLRVYKKSIKE
jgi:hypothetical protein